MLQECLIHWVFARNKYDPAQGVSLRTFLDRVITNKLFDLVKERLSLKRKPLLDTLSLEELIEKEKSYFNKFLAEETTTDCLRKSELARAVANALEGLSKRQKEICNLLGEEGLNIRQVSRRMNIPNTTVQREIKRIREIFRDEGLEKYLE